MQAAELRELIHRIYVIVQYGMGDKCSQPPSKEYAELVLRRRWVDTRTKRRDVYHVGADLRRLAPELSIADQVELVLRCHRVITTAHDSVMKITNRANTPQTLRKYVS